MVARLGQRVVSKTVVWLAAVSLFLPPLAAPCRCGDHTVATAWWTFKTVEETAQPSCCGHRKRDGSEAANSCCSTRSRPGGMDRCCQDREIFRAAWCLATAASVAKHAGCCACGEHCACGAHEPWKPPAAPAASPQRATEKAVSDDALSQPTTLCQASARCSLDAASLLPRAASCGLCVQFCHLTI